MCCGVPLKDPVAFCHALKCEGKKGFDQQRKASWVISEMANVLSRTVNVK